MGDVCYRLQRVPHRASGIGQAGFLANRWIAPFSKRWARGVCGEAWCQPPDGLPAQAVLHAQHDIGTGRQAAQMRQRLAR